MNLDYLKLTIKGLRRKKLRSWLTMIGIFIGITAVVSLVSLGDGLRSAVTSQFGISTTEVLTIQAGGLSAAGPPGLAVSKKLTDEDAEAIEKIGSVKRVLKRYLPSGKLEFNDRLKISIAMSVPDKDNRKFMYEVLELEAEAGRLLKDGDTDKVVLGYNFYTDNAGFEKEIRPGDSIILQDKKFEVVGIAKKKGSFIFDNIVHVNEEPLKDLMGIGNEVDLIVAQAKSKDLIDKAKKDIEKLLRDRRDVKIGEEDFAVTTPQASLAQVNQILLGVQIFITMIAAISMLVGGIGIANTMATSVLERKKQIGIMKAIGAKNIDIFYQFFTEAGLLGLIGGFFGIIGGKLIGYLGIIGINAFVGSSISPELNLPLIIGALLGSFLLGSIAGVIPAMKAARQNPVDALRG